MSEEVYTQEQADKDIFASMDSVDICERVHAVTEADRTEDEVGDLFRNERHLALKMQKPLFVSSLSEDQKSRIDALNVSL
jgi:hypothetical protein